MTGNFVEDETNELIKFLTSKCHKKIWKYSLILNYLMFKSGKKKLSALLYRCLPS